MIEFVTNIIEFIANNIDIILSWSAALTSSIFAYQTQKKDKKIQIELAKYEVLNEQLTYVRNSYFDYEFDIYKELSKKTFLLTSALNTYFFQGFRQIHESDLKQKEKAEELLKKVIESYYEYRDTLFMSGPFMQEDEFNEFEKFMNLCFLQYQIFCETKDCEGKSEFLNEKAKKANENDAKITKSQTELIKTLRIYVLKRKNVLPKEPIKNDSSSFKFF